MRRWRHPPLWLRYVLAITAASALLVVLVVVVQNSSGGAPAPENPVAEAQANRESQIIVAQDQAPHAASLAHVANPQRAFAHAIAADASGRIRHHELSGPLQSIRCARSGVQPAARRAFRCTVVAGNVRYAYLGVIDLRAGKLIWCKRDSPPTPAVDVAVSPRCRD